MAQVRIAVLAAHFGARHAPARVDVLNDIFGDEGLGETRPTRARFKFVRRAKQGLARDDIHVDTGFLMDLIHVTKRGLGAVLL